MSPDPILIGMFIGALVLGYVAGLVTAQLIISRRK